MFKKIEIKISLLIFFYGLFSNNFLVLEDKEKAFMGIFLFTIPLLFQLTRTSQLVKIYAIWFGVFLVLQSILFAIPYNQDFKTLKPDLNRTLNFAPGILNGIEGSQNIITDSKGFRITKPINYNHKAENKYRIFAIGGSTTEQIYIDQYQTWTHLLQEKLDQKYQNRDFEVINTGLSGLRTPNLLATLKKISNYHPDMVVFLIGINDWNYHIASHYKSSKPEDFYQKFQNLTTRLSFEICWDKFYVPIRNLIKLKLLGIDGKKVSDALKEIKFKGSLFKDDQREFKPDDVLESYKDTLDQINQICDNNKIKCVFLTQPNGYKKSATEKYKENFWMTPPGEEYTLNFDSMIYISKLYNDYLKEFARKNNKIMCDLDANIPASPDYMYDDCHYNTAGAKKVSEILFNCIENKL